MRNNVFYINAACLQTRSTAYPKSGTETETAIAAEPPDTNR